MPPGGLFDSVGQRPSRSELETAPSPVIDP